MKPKYPASRKISRRGFLKLAGLGAGAGAAAVVPGGIVLEKRYGITDGLKELFSELLSEKPAEHYTGDWVDMEVNCRAKPGKMIYDISGELVDIFSEKKESLENAGEWRREYTSRAFWTECLCSANKGGFAVKSGKCYMEVPEKFLKYT